MKWSHPVTYYVYTAQYVRNMYMYMFYMPCTDDDDVDLETRMRLLSLSHAGDPDVLILAAAAGDISTMRNFLQGAPDKVLTCTDTYNIGLHAHTEVCVC